MTIGFSTTLKQEALRSPLPHTEVIISCLTGLLRDFKPHRPARFLLTNGSPIYGITMWRDVFDFQGNYITAAKLAVDCDVEKRQVAHTMIQLQSGTYRPNMLWLQRRFLSKQFPFIPRSMD